MAQSDLDMARADPDEATEAMWRQRFADQQASGRSVREWCDRHDMPERQPALDKYHIAFSEWRNSSHRKTVASGCHCDQPFRVAVVVSHHR